MIPVTESLINNRNNRPFTRLVKLKGIIIHWTSNTNKGADAQAHFNYFQDHDVQASAHYMVDDKKIIQIIPDDEVAYHVGSRYYKPIGESIMEGALSPNYFLIGIEMCVNSDSIWENTYKNTVDLTRYLLQKHNLNSNQIWRHWDITGKDCPKMMCESEDEAWYRFLNIVNTNTFPDESTIIATGIVNADNVNIRQGNGTFFPVAGTLSKNNRVNIYEHVGSWYRIGKGQWVSSMLISAQTVQQPPKSGVINANRLNVRSGPSMYHQVIGTLLSGEKVNIFNQESDWYHIGDNRWVNKAFIRTEPEALRKGRVIPNSLNIRAGAGTNQPIVGSLKKNNEVNILEERNGWFNIAPNQWVAAHFISEIILKKGKVNASRLNVRQGPGINFEVVGSINRNDTVIIEQEEGNWYGIGVDRWVHREYIILEGL